MIALFRIPAHLGYLALAALVGAESAGVPLPGETALIAAGVLAQQGQLNVAAVVGVAAAAAIFGDNLGYAIGRLGGRRLLEARGPLARQRRALLARGQPFFARHGAKAVFLGRWFAGLRIAAAWLAGVNHMPWRRFLLWNALGGVVWAVVVGFGAYLLGSVAERLFRVFGAVGIGVAVVAAIALLLWRRRRRRRQRRGRGGRGLSGTVGEGSG